jgi:hypothetical protein
MGVPRHYTVGLQKISDALIACGFTKLDEQAKALGIRRSTAWIVKRNTSSTAYRQRQLTACSQILSWRRPFVPLFTGT